MPQFIADFFAIFVDYAWGMPLVILLMGGGLTLLIYSHFLPFRGLLHAFLLLSGKFKHPGENHSQGQLSHFQALSNALAATVGLGNISGVAVALSQGGPGAIFWMWVAAFIGMNTKFFECTLAVMYRGKDYMGEVQGGPMYVIEKALPPIYKPLAYFFAFCGLIGCMALFQTNQLSVYVAGQYGVPPLAVGIASAFFVALVVKGGVVRLGQVCGTMVPTMTLFYFGACLFIILSHWEKVPEAFSLIFKEAFSGRAAIGGAAGIAVIEVLKIGIKRAAFSNEAGVGTAPMAHANVKTNEPVSEGLVAMLGPLFDTLIICTLTALVILVSVSPQDLAQNTGIVITTLAFERTLPQIGVHLLGLAILFFATTTMLGMANYNEKCWHYLFRGRWFLSRDVFMFLFCMTMVVASISQVDDVVNILDSGYALMAFPNMIATLLLAPRAKADRKSVV